MPNPLRSHPIAIAAMLVGCSINADKVDGQNASAFAPAAHTHQGSEVVTQVASSVSADSAPWAGLTGVPATFPPSSHTHAGSDVTTPVAEAAAAGSAPWSGLTGVPALAPAVHQHDAADIASGLLAAARVPGLTIVQDAHGNDLGPAYAIDGGTGATRRGELEVLLLEQPGGPGTPRVLVWRSMAGGNPVVSGDSFGSSCFGGAVSFTTSDCSGAPYFTSGASAGMACVVFRGGLVFHALVRKPGAVLSSVSIRSSLGPNGTCQANALASWFVEAVDLGPAAWVDGPLDLVPQ